MEIYQIVLIILGVLVVGVIAAGLFFWYIIKNLNLGGLR